ncbi:Inhibitor of sigma-G Gin [[Clostridium] ultunense Esp]|uniref:sigma factor G inhibitor Gin n=1 Tax=Thermicanus aegyptius TaxID=94009 RepID=UPI0002B6F559|nr:sigma factor G inhibitor Gin [Thermicanus aegyptius]CCQ98221.1 Inhibitor of sigma-G Gin [[Clostridium] ultunense Esp]
MPRCIICDTEKEEGIDIWKSFICNECEQEMVRTEVSDHRYNDFIHKLKKIWLKQDA